MAVNTVDIIVNVRGTAEARRQIEGLTDSLRRAGLVGDVGGRIGAPGGAAAGGAGFFSRLPWQVQAGAVGALASPAAVPPIGAALGLGAFAAIAAGSGVAGKALKGLERDFTGVAQRMGTMVTQALGPVIRLGHDLIGWLAPLATAGGKILDAFIRPLDALVRSQLFGQFIAEMSKTGILFAKLFGPELAQILGSVLRLFTQLAPAGMALWRALGPLVTVLVDQLAGVLGKLIPPLARALGSLFSALTPLIPPLAKILVNLLVPVAKLIQDLAPLIGKLASTLSMQLLKALIPTTKSFADLLNALLPVLPPLVRLLNLILPPLITLLNKPLLIALTAVAKTITNVVGPAITWFVNVAVSWLKGATTKITGFFADLGPNLAKLGKQAFTDLWAAIKTVAGNIVNWAKGWVSNFLSIFSPIMSIWHAIHGGSGGSTSSPGPSTSRGAANAALARRMMPAWSSGANWSAWNNVAMHESGWDNWALNKASGAFGIPQALPPTKMPFAAQAAGGAQPGAQIAWMISYMANRYGGPQGAWNWWQGHGWYGGGLDGIVSKPTLIGVGERGPERVQVTPLGRGVPQRIVLEIRHGDSEFDRFMARWIRKYVFIHGGGDVQHAFGQ